MTDLGTGTAVDDSSSPRLARWRSMRGRAALAFSALAFLLSAAMAVAVWLAVSGFLLLERERSGQVQAAANAATVQRALETDGLAPADALARAPRESGATALLAHDGGWFTTSLDVGRTLLPAGLRRAVLDDGQPSRQRISVSGRTVLVIGVPLPRGAYFTVLPLDELSRTLRVLGTVLVTAVALTPLVALAPGWWLTRPALRPLSRLSDAAARVASGDTRARIDPGGDPELVRIARSFNTTAAALERRVRADARFATDVAHELRSPLTTMLTAVSLVEAERDRLDEDGREALALLQAEVERFSRLVQDLLEMSRSDAGDADATFVPVVLAELVRKALPPDVRDRLVVEPEASRATVMVDKRRLERVIANLVDNAEHHGRGLRSVTVTRSGDDAVVWVDDAGPGVAAEDRERIFERFTRGPGTDRGHVHGVGLGLALVVRHVRLLGGRVWVEDSPHGGARFALVLPTREDT
ncbi:HAMP domain-containing sensor histidine kinase [Cellulomonas septica]|uniref:histidine kinase n=1 Tax=Cellulomonas septica TaxID=285080 RepID=A0ABX1JXJ2_9CELL|nr:HAMP domain-containing sensor histidine kinase [Cellulomonas septica]NKY38067.1 HAMP domain-containing histidine kinase [Cellulomonas septica]